MIRTSLINGVINLDSDFSKYIESLSKPGVIEGLNVQDGVVKPGKARVKAERTNGETIYCYVENTEDVSLSGNDGKVYIVIDQEDIDNGLVREDGSNIARIEEGDDRPTKNFLKLWSKTGAIIKDEREMVKKINEVNEDLEEEISGIDTRLTEAEHDIHQIIGQSGSALSYLDTTCYAGEEIHENDLIVTNGNSFNPDRTDESTDVGGQTVNKYAIGFVGNGETTDTFSVKTSVNLGTEPDAVTINIESDDNGKPSGTVLATSSSLDIFKNPTDYSNPNILKNSYPSDVSYDTFLLPSVLNADLSNYQNAVGTMAKGTITIKGTTYSISGNNKYLKWKSNDDRYYLFVARSLVSTEAQIVKIDGGNLEVIYNGDFGFVMGYASFAFNEDGTMFYIISPTGGTGNQTVYIYKLTTPYDFSSKIDETTFDMGSLNLSSAMDFYDYCRLHGQIITNELNEKKIFFTMEESNTRKTFCFSLDENGGITSYTSYSELPYPFTIGKRAYFGGVFDYSSKHPLLIKEGGLAFNYTPYHSKISLSLQTERHKKYRLTIAPERTGSVVNCAVIYDKEGEYYSEVAVKDMNNWSNVSDKTPYIDANCILARYALKSNLIDGENKIPRGFANGDYTNLSSVSYCFKGKKSGFQGLEQDTIYYSDNDGKITTNLGPCKVGQTTNDTDLIVNIDFGGKSFSKSYSGKFTDSFKVPYDGYIKYSFTLDHTTYSFVVGGTNVIDTKSGNQGSSANTISLAYTFVPAGTTITLSTRDNNGTASVSGTVDFLSAREN